MALDFDKLAAHQATASLKGGNFETTLFFKPQNGVNKIRIVPDWATTGPYAGLFWREVYQHWRVSEENKAPITCNRLTPHTKDKTCPICEFLDTLKAKKGDPEADHLLKEMRAQQSFLIPVIDLTNPTYTKQDVLQYAEKNAQKEAPFAEGDPKVQVFTASSKVHTDIVDMIVQNRLDITDPVSGRDIFIKKVPAKGPNDFTKYTVSSGLNPTPSPATSSVKIPNLETVNRSFTVEEVRQLLATGPGGSFAALSSGNKASAALPSAAAASPDPDDALPDSYFAKDDEEADLEAEMQAALGG